MLAKVPGRNIPAGGHNNKPGSTRNRSGLTRWKNLYTSRSMPVGGIRSGNKLKAVMASVEVPFSILPADLITRTAAGTTG